MYCPHTYWNMVTLPVSNVLKKTEFLPTLQPYQKPWTVKSYTLVFLSQFLRTLFHTFLSRLFLSSFLTSLLPSFLFQYLFRHKRERLLQKVSMFLIFSYEPTIINTSTKTNLPCPWQATAAQTLNINLAYRGSMDHCHSYGLWQFFVFLTKGHMLYSIIYILNNLVI